MEVFKTINDYQIYIGGTWCEVTNKNGHVFDGSVAEGTTAEEVYRMLNKMEIVNNANIKIKLTGEVEKVDNDFIKKLKEASEPIYWNDSTCTHYIMMFKINNLWLESTNINNELTEITFNVFE